MKNIKASNEVEEDIEDLKEYTVLEGTISCLDFNAQSLVCKRECLQATIEAMKPDVVGITESWGNESISDAELDIAGYDMFRKDRPTTNKGGEVLLHVRSVLNPSEFHPRSNFPEQVWWKLTAADRSHVLIGVC